MFAESLAILLTHSSSYTSYGSLWKETLKYNGKRLLNRRQNSLYNCNLYMLCIFNNLYLLKIASVRPI